MDINAVDEGVEHELATLERKVMIGRVIGDALVSKDSALNVMLKKTEQAAIEAGCDLISADLTTEQGIRAAASAQTTYLRHVQLIAWIYQFGADADEADERLSEIAGADDDEELRSLIYGKRNQHHPD